MAGIRAEPARGGNGFVVLSEREPFPSLPFWLEKGTKRMAARPYFFASALLEESSHRRRIEDALREAIEAKGLGE